LGLTEAIEANGSTVKVAELLLEKPSVISEIEAVKTAGAFAVSDAGTRNPTRASVPVTT
jgi:hypothetical protein